MIYIMSRRMYWGYIGEDMSHEGLINYLNINLGLREEIVELHITSN